MSVGAGATLAAPMMMAAAQAAPSSPAQFSMPRRRMLSVTDYGAMGDGVTDDTAAIQKGLDAAFRGGDSTFICFPPGVYKVSKTLTINLTSNVTRNCGIIAHGARIESAITNGTDVLRISANAICRFVHLQGVDVRGNGRERHGIVFDCQNGGYLYNISLRDCVVQGCGADGLHMIGNVFEGQVINSYFRGNGNNGASFGHGSSGILSAMHVFGCIFGDNGNHGSEIFNWAYDVSYHGCYFLLNKKFGLHAKNGCNLISNCGFENNHQGAGGFANGDAGCFLQNFGTMIGCTAYSIFNQTHLVRSYVVSNLTLIGCTGSGSGNAKNAKLAKLSGDGTCKANLIGCRGGIDYGSGIEGFEMGSDDFGAAFGSKWNSKNLARLGDFRLWVDGSGRLRMKNGDPTSDGDGRIVGTQA